MLRPYPSEESECDAIMITDLPDKEARDTFPTFIPQKRLQHSGIRHGAFLSLLLTQILLLVHILQTTSYLDYRLSSYIAALNRLLPRTPMVEPHVASGALPDMVCVVQTSGGNILSIVPALAPGDCPSGPLVNSYHQVIRFPLAIFGFDDHMPLFICPA